MKKSDFIGINDIIQTNYIFYILYLKYFLKRCLALLAAVGIETFISHHHHRLPSVFHATHTASIFNSCHKNSVVAHDL